MPEHHMASRPMPPTFSNTEVPIFDPAGENLTNNPIGDIIRVSKNLNDHEIEDILDYQNKYRVRFGDAAVALGYARHEDVLWALSQQFNYHYAPAPGGQLHPDLVVANHPFSEQVEAFRDLRSQLMTGPMAPVEMRRTLAIVSPDMGDGRTFIAANLAAAFSQLAGRTLLVDADLRSPRLQKLFDIGSSNGGLSGILAGRSKPNVIRPVAELPNLYVLPAGAVPPNPLELLQHSAFRLLMDKLAARFDYVIVDTPAVVHGSDARVVAACCASALIVGRQNQSRSPAVQMLAAQLAKAQTRVAGVVMNAY